MAQSIKLGNDLFLDASGVDGIKAVLTSGDLNDYYGIHKSGVYYLNASASAFSNCPQGYSTLFVYSGTSGGAQQMILQRGGIWYRDRSESPVTWSDWKKLHGMTYEDVTITTGSTLYSTMYYGEATPTNATRNSCVSMVIYGVDNNRLAYAVWTTNTTLRIYSPVASTHAFVRVWYTT